MVINVNVSETSGKKSTKPKQPSPPKLSFGRRIKNKITLWKTNFSRMPLGHRIILLSISLGITVLASIALLYGYIIFSVPPREPLDTSYRLLLVQTTNAPEFSFNLPEPPQVKDQENPINGVLYTRTEFESLKEKKPLMVMIENHVDARPQAGLSQADLVYETLVESGITRFMAVYWGNEAPKLGPIRSIRTYYLDWASEYNDPPVLHIGQAGYEPWEEVIVPEADARSYIRTKNIKSFIWYGKTVTWRDREKFNSGIAWEHVAYSDTETAWEEARNLGWVGPADIESLEFKRDSLKENRPFSQKIDIRFLNLGGETYRVQWEFDKDNNLYNRSLAGAPHIDENNNKQITAKNVILQYCGYRATGDRNGRILLSTIGNGKALIFRDGKMVEGVWEKADRTTRTKFYDSSGEEIELNRGQIWIEIIPTSGGEPLSDITIQ